jgi:hypothetical protein
MSSPLISDAALAKATFDEWWTFGSTLFGALVGSVVGGLISYFLVRQSNAETAKRDLIIRRYNEKAIAFKLVVKIGEVVSSLAALHHQIENGISAAEAAGIGGPLWSKMQPMVGLEKRINFDPEEIAILLPLKLNETINSLFVLDDQHNSFAAAMEIYSQKRTAFGEKFGATMTGSVGVTEMTIEQHTLAGLLIAEMDALAKGIRADSKKWFEESKKKFLARSALVWKSIFPIWRFQNLSSPTTTARKTRVTRCPTFQ